MQTLREQHHPLPVDAREPVLALLPGSRSAEVRYGLPVQWAAAQEVFAEHPELRPVICCADESIAALARRVAPAAETAPDARAVMARARFALVCSGTAVLEAALLGCPGVVTYHGSPLQRWEWERFHVPGLARLREAGIASPYISLPNIISGRPLYPEFLDRPASAIAAAALEGLRADPQEVRAQLDQMSEALYWNDAGEAVAAAVREAISAPRA
jgi:lipid-A-disaccharide synthase